MNEQANCRWTLFVRKRILVNTDSQRRCYDGVNFSEEQRWTDWGEVCTYREKATAEDSARVFLEINPSREYKVARELA